MTEDWAAGVALAAREVCTEWENQTANVTGSSEGMGGMEGAHVSCDGDVTIARCGDSRHRVREAELSVSRARVERSRADRSPQTDSPAMVGRFS